MGIVLVKLDEMKTSSNVNSEMINPINKKKRKQNGHGIDRLVYI